MPFSRKQRLYPTSLSYWPVSSCSFGLKLNCSQKPSFSFSLSNKMDYEINTLLFFTDVAHTTATRVPVKQNVWKPGLCVTLRQEKLSGPLSAWSCQRLAGVGSCGDGNSTVEQKSKIQKLRRSQNDRGDWGVWITRNTWLKCWLKNPLVSCRLGWIK